MKNALFNSKCFKIKTVAESPAEAFAGIVWECEERRLM